MFRVLTVLGVVFAAAACGTAAETSSATPAARGSPASTVETTAVASRTTSAGGRPSAAPPAKTAARTGTALALLAALPVKGRAAKTGYSREEFGQTWADTDRNGCDTRNDILRRDLTNRSIKQGTHGCVVLAGDLADAYTAAAVHFVRGGPSEVDIDHMVALGDAWQTGATGWPAGKRLAFANDPLNLLTVAASANRQKGDADAASWLPANKGYRCAYVARQVAVKARYQLWVTAAERDAVVRVLRTCPAQAAPAGGAPTLTPVAASAPRPTAAPPPPATRTTAPPTSGGTDPRFATCKLAKAHGYGPYHQGEDPEYSWYRDADHDGTVCE